MVWHKKEWHTKCSHTHTHTHISCFLVWRVMSIQIMNSSTICKTKISNPIPILQALQILFQPDHLMFSQVWPSEHPKIKSIEKEGNQLKSNCELGFNDMVSHIQKVQHETWNMRHLQVLQHAWLHEKSNEDPFVGLVE